MGLQLPERQVPRGRRTRRVILLATLGLTALLLTGCGDDTAFERLGMPKPAAEGADATLHLWQGAWIAALITGGITWGLIFYAVIRFRRRSDDEIPVQTRYNLPLEILYTIAPVIMVIVFFKHTVDVQNIRLAESDTPDHTVAVVGQKWQWTFNYTDEDVVDDQNVFEAGTGSYVPTLVLPVNESTLFKLYSPDVIHDFGVPGFLMKMDVVPGRVNSYEITPTELGEFRGACYELCGTYHSRMIFRVRVVTSEEYESYLQGLLANGNVSDGIVRGGSYADTKAGEEPEPVDTEGASE